MTGFGNNHICHSISVRGFQELAPILNVLFKQGLFHGQASVGHSRVGQMSSGHLMHTQSNNHVNHNGYLLNEIYSYLYFQDDRPCSHQGPSRLVRNKYL